MKAHDTRYAARNLPEIPAAFLERMERLLGGEYPAFLASYAEHPTRWAAGEHAEDRARGVSAACAV